MTVALAATALVVGFGTSPVSAQALRTAAAPVAIVCATGAVHETYDPPLTNTVRSTDIDGTENYNCTSLLTPVTSATSSYSITRTTSCLLSLQPPNTPSTTVYTWNTGQTSTVNYTSETAVRAVDGSVVVTALGSVGSGLGQGSAVTNVITLPALDVTACAGGGLSGNTSLTATLAIAP